MQSKTLDRISLPNLVFCKPIAFCSLTIREAQAVEGVSQINDKEISKHLVFGNKLGSSVSYEL